MHHFAYKSGILCAEDVNLAALANEVGTPFYCYSSATIERHYKVLDEAFAGTEHTICYAMKANSNQAVIKTLANLGAGMDVVSEGELRRALAAGVPARKIVFSGVGKTAREMALALREGIACFNVESEPELELLNDVAGRVGQRAAISIRVNPDVDAKTMPKSPRVSPIINSASPISAPRKSMPVRRLCPTSMSPAWTCTSAARSLNSHRLSRPSSSWQHSSIS